MLEAYSREVVVAGGIVRGSANSVAYQPCGKALKPGREACAGNRMHLRIMNHNPAGMGRGAVGYGQPTVSGLAAWTG